MKKKRVSISWSGGKDSAFALHKILLSGEFTVEGLHTVIGKENKRVGMHGVREELIEQQARALDLPLTKIYLEDSEDHEAYGKLMRTFYGQCAANGLDGIVFGDIFLEDLKVYRETLLKDSGLRGVFPLWKKDTKILIKDFIKEGFKTILCAANSKYFSASDISRIIDQNFINSLPEAVDPCGENGEFHTFVYAGPIFKHQIHFEFGEVVRKTYHYQIKKDDGSTKQIETVFLFQDLLPRIAS